MENICCDVMPHEPHFVRSVRHDVTTNIFAYGPHSRLTRAYYLIKRGLISTFFYLLHEYILNIKLVSQSLSKFTSYLRAARSSIEKFNNDCDTIFMSKMYLNTGFRVISFK